MQQPVSDLKSGASLNHDACPTCRFGRQAPIDPGNIGAPRLVECRRYPQQIVMVPTQAGIVPGAVSPSCRPDFWCGEYKPKQEQAANGT